MAESIMLNHAKDFAVDVIKTTKDISTNHKEYVLTKQLVRSATSVGANIHESKYASSKADFISKMQIALKECYETEYWLELLNRSEYLNDSDYKKLNTQCGSIRKMLISSINTTKSNMDK